ncbi:MAG TPA: GNAT family N-acetyltransferase [Gaiellaceae bacterium]|nr:GNAT family N-acetyltransferase [Gaiellaceae bacterium]
MIRRARPEDAPAIATLFRRSFGTLSFLPVVHTPEEYLRHVGHLIREHELWVFEVDDDILGFASLDDGELSNLYVEPDVIGQGIGSMLLDHAKARRPDGFRLWVFQENERARAFYERRGCTLVELTDGSDNEQGAPDALYQWRPTREGRASGDLS